MTIERCPEPVNFKEMFKTVPGETFPKKRTYKGKSIFLIDKFPIKDKETLIFSIESVNSRYPQGFSVHVYNGYLNINGEPMDYDREANVLFWEDSTVLDVKNIEVQVFTKKDHIFISNIWEETIYEKVVIDGTKPAHENEKTIKYPEGKKVTCYANSGRWHAGLCNGAAMYSEDIPNGKRYHCNDGVEDDDFDDIIFTVTRQT